MHMGQLGVSEVLVAVTLASIIVLGTSVTLSDQVEAHPFFSLW